MEVTTTTTTTPKLKSLLILVRHGERAITLNHLITNMTNICHH
jgi:hypothetical protein